MSKNEVKKMIVFSTLQNKKVIEGLVADEAAVTGRSASFLIERCLLEGFLPKNREASCWVQCLYGGTCKIEDVLHTCFSYLAAGVNWEAKHDNVYGVVNFAYQQACLRGGHPEHDAEEIPYFLSQLNSISGKLQSVAQEIISKNGNCFQSREVQKEADFANDLFKLTENNPSDLSLCSVYQLVRDNWEYLKNWSRTYRLLACLVKMQKSWNNTADTRCELVKIICDMTASWGNEG